MTQENPSLEQARRKLTDLVTALVQQSSEVLSQQQADLQRRFPAMASQAAPIALEAEAIRDFAESEEYRRALNDYVNGRLEVNLLVRVLELLSRVAPLTFALN